MLLKKKPLKFKSFIGNCREEGIRTPGGVTLNSFQDCRIRPLCHFSNAVANIHSLFEERKLFFKNDILNLVSIKFPMDELIRYGILLFAGLAAGIINTLAGGGSLLTLPVLIFMGLPPYSRQRDQSNWYCNSGFGWYCGLSLQRSIDLPISMYTWVFRLFLAL